ncbi:hypothetical protein M2432_004164 [Mycobacterium sp. OTB74]|jgi:hypothetical protein|nr:hypothetical protein [Mycobacterium sp. OTB74]
MNATQWVVPADDLWHKSTSAHPRCLISQEPVRVLDLAVVAIDGCGLVLNW